MADETKTIMATSDLWLARTICSDKVFCWLLVVTITLVRVAGCSIEASRSFKGALGQKKFLIACLGSNTVVIFLAF